MAVSEGGLLEVDDTEHEICLLLAGKVRLTDQYGHVDTYGMGDGFVIPMGFEGTWETLEAGPEVVRDLAAHLATARRTVDA